MKKSRYGILIIFAVLLVLICGCNKKDVAKIVGDLGFTYNAKQDIYESKVDAWQRRSGYSSLIDLSSVPAGMVIDCEPIVFTYNGKPYMVELWKGQYDLSTGSEIGIYKKSDPNKTTWDCGDNNDMLQMSYSLKKNGKEIYHRTGKHWWLTGFKPGEFSNPEDFTMDITISFDNHLDMRDPFINGMKQIGYNLNKVKVNGNTVKFIYDRPKTKQPITDPVLIAETQKKNMLLVNTYNNVKKEVGVTDNSPASIEKMLIKMPDLILHLTNYKISK
jgi:hypothetical protein